MGNENSLLAALSSEDSEERRFAVQDLGDMQAVQAVGPIALLMGDTDVSVAEASVEALINIQHAAVVGQILPFLESEAVELRNRAIEVLERYVGTNAQEILEYSAHSSNVDVRKFALDILAHGSIDPSQRSERIFQLIEKLGRDPNVNVAGAAIELLGQWQENRVCHLIQERIYDDSWIQWVSIEVLNGLNNRQAYELLLTFKGDLFDAPVRAFLIETRQKLAHLSQGKAS